MPSRFCHVQLIATLWIVAQEAPLFMGFSRQEYWSGWPCPPPGDLPDPGIEPTSLMSSALAGRFFTSSTTWEAHTLSCFNHAQFCDHVDYSMPGSSVHGILVSHPVNICWMWVTLLVLNIGCTLETPEMFLNLPMPAAHCRLIKFKLPWMGWHNFLI